MPLEPPFMKGRRFLILLELRLLKLKEKHVGLSEIEKIRVQTLQKELAIIF